MLTNLYPIKFDFKKYQVSRVKGDFTFLKDLRKSHNTTHSFFKNGEYIYFSNKTGEDLGIGEVVEMSVVEDYSITASLVKHIFFKTFLENYPKYKPSSFYPFRIQSLKEENDLVRPFLSEGLKGKLSYIKEIELQLRECNLNGVPRICFLINISRNWKLDISCQILHEKGFNLIGFEVIHSITTPGLENILIPDETLLGTISEIVDDIALVETNEGEVSYELADLYIRKTDRNIKEFLLFALRDQNRVDKIFEKLKVNKNESIEPVKILNEVEEYAKFLFLDKDKNSQYFQNKDGFYYNVQLNNKPSFKSYNLEPPFFVFDPARSKINKVSDSGLRSFGPYDTSYFSPKEPQFLVLCHQENRIKISSFVGELINGIPNSRYYTKGFKSKYELYNVSFDIKEVSNYNLNEYEQIFSKVSDKPELVIIEIPSSFKLSKEVKNSLYYQLKSYFLSLEIPVQIVTTEIVKQYDEYKLNAIALQMYAKLGGVPWTILTKNTSDREIIIGIGNSVFRDNSYTGNNQERIVGISTFFSGDGQYMMSGGIKDVSYDKYFEALLDSLRESIKALAQEYGWRGTDTIRLIFHIFKPIKNVEFEVVKQLIIDFSEYKIKFAFVTISEFHPYLMFDENQIGFEKRGDIIAKMVPNRGANIVINDSSCLVQMLGPYEMKTGKHGASKPLLIRILRPTSMEIEDHIKPLMLYDLEYITQQIFKFTYLSWRSFLPNQRPATMLYSTLISRLLAKLRRVPGWKSEVVNFELKHTKWFL